MQIFICFTINEENKRKKKKRDGIFCLILRNFQLITVTIIVMTKEETIEK